MWFPKTNLKLKSPAAEDQEETLSPSNSALDPYSDIDPILSEDINNNTSSLLLPVVPGTSVVKTRKKPMSRRKPVRKRKSSKSRRVPKKRPSSKRRKPKVSLCLLY